ncbi:unnamed protein product, partial [Polarella glacialis]
VRVMVSMGRSASVKDIDMGASVRSSRGTLPVDVTSAIVDSQHRAHQSQDRAKKSRIQQ